MKPRFESWRIFKVAIKCLGPTFLSKLYTRSSRLVYYWAQDPRFCERSERNPIDRIRDMLDAMDDAGKGEYARAAVDYMAQPLGCCCADINSATSDKGTIDGEIADISIALGRLGTRIREALTDDIIDTAETIRIKNAARDLKREIEQLLDAAGLGP